MRHILQLVVLLILGGAVGAQGATLNTTLEQNEPNTLLWSGIWEFPVNENVAEATITNPTGGSGPWTVSLTVKKEYVNGNNLYKMFFKGNHKPDGGVAEFNSIVTADKFLAPDTKLVTATHGTAKDQWSFYVEPDPAALGKIKWVVRASHVVPEPSAVAAVAATGLLIFGVARRARARAAGN